MGQYVRDFITSWSFDECAHKHFFPAVVPSLTVLMLNREYEVRPGKIFNHSGLRIGDVGVDVKLKW